MSAFHCQHALQARVNALRCRIKHHIGGLEEVMQKLGIHLIWFTRAFHALLEDAFEQAGTTQDAA